MSSYGYIATFLLSAVAFALGEMNIERKYERAVIEERRRESEAKARRIEADWQQRIDKLEPAEVIYTLNLN